MHLGPRLLGVAAVLAAGCSSPTRDGSSASAAPSEPPPAPARADDAPAPRLTVMSYNVNFGMPGDADTVAAIRDADADIVVLQETNRGWERALRRELADQYPHMAFRHCCRAGGLAVLAKTPFEPRDYAYPKAGLFPAWRIEADTPIGPIQLLGVHLTPVWQRGRSWLRAYMDTRGLHEREMRQLAELLDPDRPALVLGDFNEDAGTGTATRLLGERGFESVLVAFQIADATWRWQTRRGQISWQLDHIMFEPRLRAVAAEVIEAGASDHLPLLATFERATDAPR